MSNNVVEITPNNIWTEYNGYKKFVTHTNISFTYAFDFSYYKS